MTSEGDDSIRAVVARLGRPHPSGGTVVEGAAVLAEGADYEAIARWIVAHGGKAEAAGVTPAARGIHGARPGGAPARLAPSRFVLPPGALDGS